MLRSLNNPRAAGRVCGTWRMGKRASEIPTGGAYPALLLNDIAVGDPADCEYSTEILTWPSVGTLAINEDSTYLYTPPAGYSGTVGGTQLVRKYTATGLFDSYVEDYGWQLGNAVSSDLAVAYNIGGAVTRDLVASYKLNEFVSADLGAIFDVSTALQLVTSDLAGAYKVESFVAGSLFATYQLLSNIVFARAPAGAGYIPRRSESAARPAAIQQDYR